MRQKCSHSSHGYSQCLTGARHSVVNQTDKFPDLVEWHPSGRGKAYYIYTKEAGSSEDNKTSWYFRK